MKNFTKRKFIEIFLSEPENAENLKILEKNSNLYINFYNYLNYYYSEVY